MEDASCGLLTGRERRPGYGVDRRAFVVCGKVGVSCELQVGEGSSGWGVLHQRAGHGGNGGTGEGAELDAVRVRWYRYWGGKREQHGLPAGRTSPVRGQARHKARQGKAERRTTRPSQVTGEDCTGVSGFAGGLWSATMQSMQGCRLSALGVCSPVSRSFRVLCVLMCARGEAIVCVVDQASR
jgi:hypothetical protein